MKPDAVKILVIDSNFVVRVIKNGETTEQSYSLEESARAFAEGQRIRLKLKSYRFVRSNEDA